MIVIIFCKVQTFVKNSFVTGLVTAFKELKPFEEQNQYK